MIILGIDPGTKSIGYALIKSEDKPRLLEAGLISTTQKTNAGRLLEIHLAIRGLIIRWRPERISLERLFFAKNAKTAISVAEARGAILLTASLHHTKLFEYTPLEVKKAVTGRGRADKIEVEKILRLSLRGAEKIRAKDDVFDAMAIAFTNLLLEKRSIYSINFKENNIQKNVSLQQG